MDEFLVQLLQVDLEDVNLKLRSEENILMTCLKLCSKFKMEPSTVLSESQLLEDLV